MANQRAFESVVSPSLVAIVESASKPEHLYLDRELSLLAFQSRVLEEAQDRNNPLLERLKFLAILYVEQGKLDPKLAGPKEIELLEAQIRRIRAEVCRISCEMDRYFRSDIFPLLTPLAVLEI